MRKTLNIMLAAAMLTAPLAVSAEETIAAELAKATETELVTAKPKKKTTKKTTTKKKSRTTSSKKSSKSTKKTTTASTAAETTQTSTTSSSSTSLLGGILSGLTSVFNANSVASADDLVGTWKYTEPAVVLENDNVLAGMAGKVLSNKIEKDLQKQLTKAGIVKGKMKMTFDKNGNFTQTVGNKTMSGTYKLNKKNVELTYAGGVQQFIGTTQVDGDKLLIVMDASKLLKYFKTITSLTGNSAISSLGSLLSSNKGLLLGMTLEK